MRDPYVDPKDVSDIAALVAILRKEDALPTDYLQFRHIFHKYANFKNFDTKTLVHMANFFMVEPVTGLNTFNNILKLFKVQIPVDGPYVKHLTRHIVARELKMLFAQLRNEDLTLGFEKLDDFADRMLDKVCFRRGIEIQEQNRKQKLEDLKLWISISNQRNIPATLLLMARVKDYIYNTFKITEGETQDEILRRVSLNFITFLLVQGRRILHRVCQSVREGLRHRSATQRPADDPT